MFMTSLNHPSIVVMKYKFEDDQNMYFVNELMQGHDFRKLLKEKKTFDESKMK